MEIYLERIRDLLARASPPRAPGPSCLHFDTHAVFYAAQNDNLPIHEEKSKGVYIKGLSDYYVSNAREVYEIMRQGGMARVVTATSTFIIVLSNYL